MRVTACRGCGAEELKEILSLGKMPLANSLLSEDDLSRPEPLYPLELSFCEVCALAQLTESVPPAQLFREYPYFSSVSETMVAHARAIVDRMTDELRLGPGSLAVEVASNDGYLLQHYVDHGIGVLGIDPARNVVAEAERRGVPTLSAFFSAELAADMRANGTSADVVHANNVMAHVPDINGFLQGIHTLLNDQGVAVLETPYLLDLVERLEFDTIYHEHVFYYSLTSARNLLERHGLRVFDVERLPIHGGSLRLFVCRDGSRQIEPSVPRMLEEESKIGIDSIEYFRGFSARVEELKSKLRKTIDDLKQRGHSLAAYGAAAKGAVLLNAFGIGQERIDFVVDRSPHKQGYFMPGVRIPISPPERLLESAPDYVLLLVWNFADEILDQQAEYLAQGGKFIVPIPEPRIVPA